MRPYDAFVADNAGLAFAFQPITIYATNSETHQVDGVMMRSGWSDIQIPPYGFLSHLVVVPGDGSIIRANMDAAATPFRLSIISNEEIQVVPIMRSLRAPDLSGGQ